MGNNLVDNDKHQKASKDDYEWKRYAEIMFIRGYSLLAYLRNAAPYYVSSSISILVNKAMFCLKFRTVLNTHYGNCGFKSLLKKSA
jgi:hypothetical protein